MNPSSSARRRLSAIRQAAHPIPQVLIERVRSTNWRRVVASGAVWTLVYNVVWGVAWFVFMRQEWEEAVAAIGRTSPWTAEVWFLWVVLTCPRAGPLRPTAS